ITALHGFGVEFALSTENATVPPIDGDAMIAEAAATYGDAEVTDVAAALARETTNLAALAADNIDSWDRTLTVGDSTNTVRWILEHALHDSTHHLDDVARGLAELRARA
ncbi:MAG TPA: hypothetical protein VHD87_05645, partial [Acidimicrobiales bacterium]|nr:hypothetical protein [Acidimicrobiales bacterium]